MIYDAYSYNQCFELTQLDSGIFCKKVNYAMSNKFIKLHKGVDNQVQFRIRDTDLKPVDVSNSTVMCRIYDLSSREKVLERYAEPGSKCGWLTLTVFEGDLVNVKSGFYKLVLVKENTQESYQEDHYNLTPFYSDTGRNIDFDVEVTDQAMVEPFPSIVIPHEKFVTHNEDYRNLAYYTSAIPCNAIRNHLNSVHSFALYMESFTGKVEILGSLDIQPPQSLRDYFQIKVTPYSDTLEFTGCTGVDAFSFECNLTWVKFRIIPTLDPDMKPLGKISQIVWRS